MSILISVLKFTILASFITYMILVAYIFRFLIRVIEKRSYNAVFRVKTLMIILVINIFCAVLQIAFYVPITMIPNDIEYSRVWIRYYSNMGENINFDLKDTKDINEFVESFAGIKGKRSIFTTRSSVINDEVAFVDIMSSDYQNLYMFVIKRDSIKMFKHEMTYTIEDNKAGFSNLIFEIIKKHDEQ